MDQTQPQISRDIKMVAMDFETATIAPDGTPTASTEAYRPDFRVTSAAFAWRDELDVLQTLFTVGEADTAAAIERFVDGEYGFVVHNIQFEWMVTKCRFPALLDRMNWHADTMRLVQYYDNAADEFVMDYLPSGDGELDLLALEEAEEEVKRKPTYIGGLRLDNCVRRLLGDKGSHKEEAYSWLRENAGVKKGHEGANLHLLPHDVLERYNIQDSVNTLRLYDLTTYKFQSDGFNWQKNHALYFQTCKRVAKRKIKGVPVHVEKAKVYAVEVAKEIQQISADFKARFAEEIAAVERGRLLNQIRKRKTLRGRKRFLQRYKLGTPSVCKEVRFNAGSNHQLAALFVGVLGIEPKFRTDKGAPSFKSALLEQWGDGGLLLQTRRKRQLVLKQTESLIQLSSYDLRWHYDFRVAGTSTGRGAGGSL